MPTLLLNNETTSLTFELTNYSKEEDAADAFLTVPEAVVHLSIKTSYMNYEDDLSFSTLADFDLLLDWLSNVINGKKVDNDIELLFSHISFHALAIDTEYEKKKEYAISYNETRIEFKVYLKSNYSYCGEAWCVILEYSDLVLLYEGLLSEKARLTKR